jgi:hypothetical protein
MMPEPTAKPITAHAVQNLVAMYVRIDRKLLNDDERKQWEDGIAETLAAAIAQAEREARKGALEEARDVMCDACRTGVRMSERFTNQHVTGWSTGFGEEHYQCRAFRILVLLAAATVRQAMQGEKP